MTTVLSESVKLDCKNTSNLCLLSKEILPHEDFIKFYKNLNSRDKDHNSVQKQIIEEFVSLKNNFNMSEVIGDLIHFFSLYFFSSNLHRRLNLDLKE
jgi:hypothetical protein